MPGTIELRGFMQLEGRFRDRGWANPHRFQLDREVEGPELLVLLDVPLEDVEVIFVNRTAFPMHQAIIRPGDRVALAPPGVPGPHRLLLGFKNKEEAAGESVIPVGGAVRATGSRARSTTPR